MGCKWVCWVSGVLDSVGCGRAEGGARTSVPRIFRALELLWNTMAAARRIESGR